MHPELFDLVYRQRERELETELHRRLVRQERAPVVREPVVARLVARFRHALPAAPQPDLCCAVA